jgi:transcriptional regulator with XRE-family HTH domain
MTIGEKVRARRKELGLTQKEVAGDAVTRNMICGIEKGTVSPSIATLYALAEALSVPVDYLVSEENDLSVFLAREALPRLRRAYRSRRYSDCVTICRRLPEEAIGDEVALILASAQLGLAERALREGNLSLIPHMVSEVEYAAARTVLPTEHLLARAELCRAIAVNPRTPKWEIGTDRYCRLANEAVGLERFRYLSENAEFPYYDINLREHDEAHALITAGQYDRALTILTGIEERKGSGQIGSYLLFRIYTDMETCYREIGNYEMAYRYSTKRLSLFSAFRE